MREPVMGCFSFCPSPQTDYHGGWDATHHQHLQIWWRHVHVSGQKPFWNIQQHGDTGGERYFFSFLHRFSLQYLSSQGFKLLLREKNSSSSMKLIMKYIAVLCSRWFDRRISHPWFCQLWVIVHVAEWGKPPPSMAVSEEYFVTNI